MERLNHYHHVCLVCRRSKKGPYSNTDPLICDGCGGEMHSLGKLFAAPRRQDDAGWRKIEWMIASGWNGFNWPVTPQMSLLEVKTALRQWRERSLASRRAIQTQMGVERRQILARARSRKRKTTLKQQRLEEERQRLYQEQVMQEVTQANQSGANREN